MFPVLLDFMILSVLLNSFWLIPEHWEGTYCSYSSQILDCVFSSLRLLRSFLVDSLHICSIHNYSPLYYRCYIFSFCVQYMVKYETDVTYFVFAVYVVVTLLLLWSNLNFHLMLALLYNLMIKRPALTPNIWSLMCVFRLLSIDGLMKSEAIVLVSVLLIKFSG